MTTIDIVAIVVIALTVWMRLRSVNNFKRRIDQLESLGYSSLNMMMTDDTFMVAAGRVQLWAKTLKVLCIGYALSWVATLMM